MSEPGYSIAAVTEQLSEPRLAPYLQRSHNDPAKALELYDWSTRMSATAFATVAHLEVLLRNAIDMTLASHSDEPARGIPWFLCQPFATEQVTAAVAAVRDRLIPQRRDTRHQIVAGLSFGFWSGMTGPKYEDLWRAALHRAFPGSSGARKQVATELEAVRKFRNRLAHHDSVLSIDIPFEMRRVRRVAGFLGADVEKWLGSIDRTSTVYAERPPSPIDTVVVPARDAWTFYEEHFAYVCQTGRWFQPVERLAFYAEQEIKPHVPLILHRRDNVPWTAQASAVLADSDDRWDRKIAAVIDASLSTGRGDGTHQVFLLSRHGDPNHRTMPAPIPHEVGGRGKGFVQRQRYVSLHALETASTTADLLTDRG